MKRSSRDADRLGETAAILQQEEEARRQEVRRARPVAGEINYAELSREHIARYPKIRAALAE
jgi:hypothetical protein